jgi:hypothetical protein
MDNFSARDFFIEGKGRFLGGDFRPSVVGKHWTGKGEMTMSEHRIVISPLLFFSRMS